MKRKKSIIFNLYVTFYAERKYFCGYDCGDLN